MPARKFPRRVYMHWEYPKDDDPYLVCSESPEEATEGSHFDEAVPVAIYELVEVGELKTSVTYHAHRRHRAAER